MVRCKSKATLKGSYCLEVRCGQEEGHQGMHWHDNYVDLEEGGECNIEVTWETEASGVETLRAPPTSKDSGIRAGDRL